MFKTFYTFSPGCRVGVVQGDVNSMQGLSLFNLEFTPQTGATAYGLVPASGADTGIYFSPDDSLAVVISPGLPGPPGSGHVYTATAYDMVTGAQIRLTSAGTMFDSPPSSINLTGSTVTLTVTGISPITWSVP